MDRRTKIALVIIAIFITLDVTWAILNYILPYFIYGYIEVIPVIPGSGVVDWLVLWYLVPILAIPFYLVMAIYTPRWLVLPLNRILNPGSEAYFYAPETNAPKPTISMLRRSIITIILTLGLSLTIARYVGWQLITYTPDLPELLNRMNAAVILMPIIFLILGLILPSSWLIEDTNIVYHSQGSSGPQEIRNAGRILMTLLAGYFGISIIIDYLNLIALTPDVVLSWITHSWPWVPLPFFFIITYINPFIYTFWPLLTLLVYYRYLPSLQNHLIGYMDSLNTQTISKMAVIDVDISEYLGEKETTNSD